MVSFHELQELFLLSHAQGILDDEELLLLYEEYSPKNPDFCYENFGRFSLDHINDAECLAEFRFRKHDLPLLAEVLQIPESFTCYQRTVSSGMEGLCILLRRLSYPCRFSDIISRFGRPVPVLSMVSNQVLDHIYDTHGHGITKFSLSPCCSCIVTQLPPRVLPWTIALDLLTGRFAQFAGLQRIREQSITATNEYMLKSFSVLPFPMV